MAQDVYVGETLLHRVLEAGLQPGLPALDGGWGGGDVVALCVLVGPGVAALLVGGLVWGGGDMYVWWVSGAGVVGGCGVPLRGCGVLLLVLLQNCLL